MLQTEKERGGYCLFSANTKRVWEQTAVYHWKDLYNDKNEIENRLPCRKKLNTTCYLQLFDSRALDHWIVAGNQYP